MVRPVRRGYSVLLAVLHIYNLYVCLPFPSLQVHEYIYLVSPRNLCVLYIKCDCNNGCLIGTIQLSLIMNIIVIIVIFIVYFPMSVCFLYYLHVQS